MAAAAIPAAPDAIFTLLQALKLLEGFDLGSMGFQKPATIHLIVEAMKVAPVLGELVVSPKMDTNVVAGLRSLGHQIKLQNPESWRIVICIDSHTGLLHGAGDSTANRHAGAF